ncbi:hypothetical protein ACH50O_04980 [Methylomonas sp. 2BW1-5-20]|uniref:hypothetical protein n=1 Tax=Methylomonas sp. 2BW1-5-20 TaxID=3376686 RepID=UPI00404DE5C7
MDQDGTSKFSRPITGYRFESFAKLFYTLPDNFWRISLGVYSYSDTQRLSATTGELFAPRRLPHLPLSYPGYRRAAVRLPVDSGCYFQ